MKLDLLGGSYAQKYADISTQRCINWYPVYFNPKEKTNSQLALYPTPGLTQYYNIAGRYSRGGLVARTTKYSRAFCIVDQTLWEILSNHSVINRGTLSNIPMAPSKCFFKVNGNQEVYIGQGTAGYVYNMDTDTLVQITDADFPGNFTPAATITSVEYLDGYLFVVANGQVYFSDANSFLNWTGSQVYHPTIRAAGTIAVAAFRDKLYNFSSETIEPYFEDNSTAIWARYPSSVIYTGALHANVVSSYDNGIVFAGKSREGETHIYMLTSESLKSISQNDPSIQWRINQKPQLLSEAWSYIQKTKDGKEIFRLFIPELKTTLVYDITSDEWYEQQSLSPSIDSDGNFNYNVFRGMHYISYAGMNLYQDYYSGKLLLEDYTVQTEDSILIRRRRTSPTYTEEYKNISVSNFELDATRGVGISSGQGVTPILMLETSINGGRTYSQPRNLPLSSIGDYLYRSRLQKMGTGRAWAIQMTITDPIDLMIQNAYAHGSTSVY